MNANYTFRIRTIILFFLLFAIVYQSGAVPAALGMNTIGFKITRLCILGLPFLFINNLKVLKKSCFLIYFILIGVMVNVLIYQESTIHLAYKVILFLLFFYVCCYAEAERLYIENCLYYVLLCILFITLCFYFAIEIFHINIPFEYVVSEGGYYYRNYMYSYYAFHGLGTRVIPRFSGLFWEPGMNAVYFNILLYLYCFGEKVKKHVWHLPVILLALVLTQSAAGYCIMLLIMYKYFMDKKYFRGNFKLAIIIIFGILMFLGILFVVLQKRSTDADNLQTYSYGLRLNDLINGLKIFARHPFFGTGYGNNSEFVAMDPFGRGGSNGLVTWMYMMGGYGTVFVLFPFIANCFVCKEKRGEEFLWVLAIILFNIFEPIYSLPIMQFFVASEYQKFFFYREEKKKKGGNKEWFLLKI